MGPIAHMRTFWAEWRLSTRKRRMSIRSASPACSRMPTCDVQPVHEMHQYLTSFFPSGSCVAQHFCVVLTGARGAPDHLCSTAADPGTDR